MAESVASNPELTAEQVERILIQPLETASVFLSAGPRVFDTDGSPVRIPKFGTMTAPSWHGENEQITEVDADFDEVVLLPSTIKSLKSLTRFSNELARQSVVSLDSVLQDRMVRDIAQKLDAAFIAGAVADPQVSPLGVINYSGTQSVDAAPTTLDPLLDAWGKLLAAGANTAAAKWLVNPADFVTLRKIKQGTGSNAYVLQADPTADGVFRLFGSTVLVSPYVPAGTAVLADFSQIAVARDQAPSVKILDQTFGDYDQMAIRVTARYDAAPLNADAVVIVKDAEA